MRKEHRMDESKAGRRKEEFGQKRQKRRNEGIKKGGKKRQEDTIEGKKKGRM